MFTQRKGWENKRGNGFSVRVLCFFIQLSLVTGLAGAASSAPVLDWQKVPGGTGMDYGYSVEQTADDGCILAGWTTSNASGDVWYATSGGRDAWVVKLNSAGYIDWSFAYGGTGDDEGWSIRQTSDGGYILAGHTFSNTTGAVGVNHGGSDAWVVKLDPYGALEWQKVLGGSANDYGTSILQTGDGGYFLAGSTHSNTSGDVGVNHGDVDIWAVKLTSAGAIAWQRVLGGNHSEQGREAWQTGDGGYIIAGDTSSNDNGDVGPAHGYSLDVWVVKLSGTGTVQWQKVLGGSDTEFGYSIQQTGDGGYILAGSTDSDDSGDVGENHGGWDVWAVKLNSAGTIQWQTVLGGSSDDSGQSIRQTGDGGYVLTGDTLSSDSGDVGTNHGTMDVWVVRLDPAGTIDWQKVLGGNGFEIGHSIRQTADGGYILNGVTSTNSSGDVGVHHGGTYDFWAVKLDDPLCGSPVYGDTLVLPAGYSLDLETGTLSEGRGSGDQYFPNF